MLTTLPLSSASLSMPLRSSRLPMAAMLQALKDQALPMAAAALRRAVIRQSLQTPVATPVPLAAMAAAALRRAAIRQTLQQPLPHHLLWTWRERCSHNCVMYLRGNHCCS